MSHTAPIPLPFGTKTMGYFSLKPPEKIIIFIHGFKGSAVGTWNDFPALIRNNSQFENCDVIFYGYDSLRGQADNNSIRFYSALKKFLNGNVDRLAYDRKLPDNFKYKNIVTVAHSLGAIILRKALLCAKTDQQAWLPSVKMVLFAPAHKGARIQSVIFQTNLPFVGRAVAGLGYLLIPVLHDLIKDSPSIRDLIDQTQEYLNKGNGDFTKAHTVVWAGKELVVFNHRFCADPVAIEERGRHHMNVARPAAKNYLNPLTYVINAL